MDLTGDEKAMAKHHAWLRSSASDKDVMCCVKTYTRDRQLQQDPLCVLPASRVDRVTTLSPTQCQGPSMTDKEKEHFQQMAQLIRDCRYGYHRAAADLQSLVLACSETPTIENHTPWLQCQAPERMPLVYPERNPFFSHLPDTSWHMKVQIHRG